jgi:general secretion pathway protein N
MGMLGRYPLLSALAIVAALLVGVLALEFVSGAALRERMAAATAPRPAVVQTKLMPPIAAVNPDQEYAETGSRPLFIPTRRPAPPQATAAAASSMNKGQFFLTAVIIAGDMKIALLREKSSGRVVRVEQGKDVNGITVAQIDREHVTLTQAGDREVVPLVVSKGAALPPGAPVPNASGPFGPPQGGPPIVPAPGAVNPAARPPVQPPVAPRALPNNGFGPNPANYPPPGTGIPGAPVVDPTTATPPVSQNAPLTPEELLAARRARRTGQTQ